MTRTQGFMIRVLSLALVAGSLGCASVPVRIEPPSQPYKATQGRNVAGSACGFQLLLFIPIEVNSRAARAYTELKAATGSDVLTDVRMRESWFYGLVGTGYCTEMSGIAYPRS
jgi:hypothetical protein